MTNICKKKNSARKHLKQANTYPSQQKHIYLNTCHIDLFVVCLSHVTWSFDNEMWYTWINFDGKPGCKIHELTLAENFQLTRAWCSHLLIASISSPVRLWALLLSTNARLSLDISCDWKSPFSWILLPSKKISTKKYER